MKILNNLLSVVGLSGLIILSLTILKISGIIAISWLVVLLPVWILPAAAVALVALVCALLCFAAFVAGCVAVFFILLMTVGVIRNKVNIQDFKDGFQSGRKANDNSSSLA